MKKKGGQEKEKNHRGIRAEISQRGEGQMDYDLGRGLATFGNEFPETRLERGVRVIRRKIDGFLRRRGA